MKVYVLKHYRLELRNFRRPIFFLHFSPFFLCLFSLAHAVWPLALDLQLDLFAVVTQRYEPEVQSPGGFLGNDVIIRCNVPAFVKEHVTVTSWLQEPAFNIYPSTVSGE